MFEGRENKAIIVTGKELQEQFMPMRWLHPKRYNLLKRFREAGYPKSINQDIEMFYTNRTFYGIMFNIDIPPFSKNANHILIEIDRSFMRKSHREPPIPSHFNVINIRKKK